MLRNLEAIPASEQPAESDRDRIRAEHRLANPSITIEDFIGSLCPAYCLQH